MDLHNCAGNLHIPRLMINIHINSTFQSMAKARETWIDLWIVTIIHWNCTLSRIVKTLKISTDLGQLSSGRMERTFETNNCGVFEKRIWRVYASALMKSFIAIIANIERYDQKELTRRSTESAVRNIASK